MHAGRDRGRVGLPHRRRQRDVAPARVLGDLRRRVLDRDVDLEVGVPDDHLHRPLEERDVLGGGAVGLDPDGEVLVPLDFVVSEILDGY